MDLLQSIREVVERKVSAMGFDLYDLKLSGPGSHAVLRVYLDRDGGVTIDDCERVSKELSVVLDVEDYIDHSYSLEVSSPGLDRRLSDEKDFRRTVGRSVRLWLAEGADDRKEIAGVVLSCADGRVRLRTGAGEQEVAIKDIVRGKIEVSFK